MTLSAFSGTGVQTTFVEHWGPLSVHEPLTADSVGSNGQPASEAAQFRCSRSGTVP